MVLQVCAQGLVPPACDELVAQYVHAGNQSTAGLADAKHYLGQVAQANIDTSLLHCGKGSELVLLT